MADILIEEISTEEQLLVRREGAVLTRLYNKQQIIREKLMGWLLETGKTSLELRLPTIELSFRLFDFFSVQLSDCARNSLLDSADQMQLTLIACLFSCSKYCEIYPPCLNDFTYVCHDRYTRQDILAKETQVVLATNCAFSLTTVSQWYEYQFGEKMPDWGYGVYAKAHWVRGREIARAVRRLVEREESLSAEVCLAVTLGLLGIAETGKSKKSK